MPLAQDGEGREQPRVVLVRPAACGIDEEALARVLARAEHGVVDPQVDRAHATLGDAQALDDGSGRVLRDRDHERAPAYRGAVCDSPVEALGSREELREELVLEIEHGRDRRRRADGRDHHGEREVHRVEAGQA